MKIAFTEGQDVKAGDVLVQLDPAPYQATLDQAFAKKAQDAAQLANARVDLQRYDDLLRTDSITQQIYDTQKALIAQLEATVNADQAAVDSAKVNLDYTTIRSPIHGRVGIRQVNAGNIVHANDANGIVVLTQLHPVSVVFTLPEQAVRKLHPKTDSPFRARRHQRARHRHARGHGHSNRYHHGRDQTQGHLRERESAPLARPVRQHAVTTLHADQRRDNTGIGCSTRARRRVRLCH